eukprot:COSAG05_NODE_2420_length_3085_cov_2.362023_3_plen_59_part_00
MEHTDPEHAGAIAERREGLVSLAHLSIYNCAYAIPLPHSTAVSCMPYLSGTQVEYTEP